MSFFCTGKVKYANLVTLDSWNHTCWSLAAAASMPRSVHHAMMVMSRAEKVSVNQWPGLMAPGVRTIGTWKSSSSKESLNVLDLVLV